MSFFIKGKNHTKGGNKKHVETRKRKLPSKPQSYKEDQEITSSEDEGLDNKRDDPVSSSEDENETAQEKKLRLAKVYLREIELEEIRRSKNKELDDALKGDGISQRLKEDYLKQQGKLRSSVAHTYTGFGIDSVTTLKCKDHKNSVTCLCISNDNKYIYSGSKDGGIVKWSLDDKKRVGSIPFVKKLGDSKKVHGHGESILCMAVSSDSAFLAVGDETSDIQIWNPLTLKHVNTLSGHRNSITGLVFRKDTHTLYSASKDRSIKVWSLDEMTYVETMYGHLDTITNIDALYRERVITAGGRDATVRIWKVAEESQLIYNGDGAASIDSIRLINEETFVSGSDSGQLCVWGVNKKKPLCFVKEAHGLDPTNSQPYWITSVASLLNTDLIGSGSQNGFINLWHLTDGFKKIKLLFKIPVIGFVNDISITNDGLCLVAATGSEHRFGRWTTIKQAKNAIHIIPLIK